MIEALVVLVIVGLVLGIVAFSLSSTRGSARDDKRKADLAAISSGLEKYRADCGRYPATIPAVGSLTGNGSTPSCLSSNTYLRVVPTDPEPSKAYAYSATTGAYILCASLEGGGSAIPGCPASCGGGTCNYSIPLGATLPTTPAPTSTPIPTLPPTAPPTAIPTPSAPPTMSPTPIPVFDYSLSNEGNKNFFNADKISNTITVTKLSGTAQLVYLSASGLPSGTWATFAPSLGCTPNNTCTSTMTISRVVSAPSGTYTVTVTGSPLSKTTSFSITIP